MACKTYQGHRSWNAYNISLWISNDEPLYRRARHLAEKYGVDRGARIMAREMKGEVTPDGGKYNFTTIREAMRDIL